MAPGVEWGELLEDGKRLDQVCLEFPGGDVEGRPDVEGSGLCGLVAPLLGTSSSPVLCHVLATRTKQMERC